MFLLHSAMPQKLAMIGYSPNPYTRISFKININRITPFVANVLIHLTNAAQSLGLLL